MSVSITNRVQEHNQFIKEVWNDRQKGEYCLCFNKHLGRFTWLNKEQLNKQNKVWRNLIKSKRLCLDDKNNKSFKIYDKKVYTFVIQNLNSDGEYDELKNSIDLLGLIGFSNKVEMVSGYIYAFTSKTNRDTIYKYLMGIK